MITPAPQVASEALSRFESVCYTRDELGMKRMALHFLLEQTSEWKTEERKRIQDDFDATEARISELDELLTELRLDFKAALKTATTAAAR